MKLCNLSRLTHFCMNMCICEVRKINTFSIWSMCSIQIGLWQIRSFWSAETVTAALKPATNTSYTSTPQLPGILNSRRVLYVRLSSPPAAAVLQSVFCQRWLWNTSASQSDCSADVGLTSFQLLWCSAGVSRFHVCLSALADDKGCWGLDLICGSQCKQASCSDPSQPDIERRGL